MQGPWDAPYDLRARFADQEDPDPPTFVQPPSEQLPPDYDPDYLLGIQHAYAGQVSVLDVCLRILLQAIWDGPHADSTLVIATSPRGFPLGEHRVVGPHGNGPHGELVHVPCLIHWPDGAGSAVRVPQLAQPADLAATVGGWLQVLPERFSLWSRDIGQLTDQAARPPHRWDRALSTVSGESQLLRTGHWAFHAAPDRPAQLFVKPDDRWEVNNVADRCPQVLQLAPDVLANFQQAALQQDWQQVAELPDLLAQPFE
jgi:arylsulfatase A-like enzyme